MKVLSVNTAKLRKLKVGTKEIETGYFKEPRGGPICLNRDGLAEDCIVTARRGGRLEQALSVYPEEHYHAWSSELDNRQLLPGAFGENLTTRGVLETEVRLGDEYQLGDALVQVTGPRIPCLKLDAAMGSKFAKRFLRSRRVGFYLRVLEPGTIEAECAIVLKKRTPGAPSVEAFTRLLFEDYWDSVGLQQLLDTVELNEEWHRQIREKLRRSTSTKYWLGKRPLVITGVFREGLHFQRYTLACQYARQLPPVPPGLFLPIVSTTRARGTSFTTRPFALCTTPGLHNEYQILTRSGAKPEFIAGGALSSFLDNQHQVGTVLAAAAPHGSFTPPPSAAEVVWVTEGLGVASLCSHLSERAATGASQPWTILHSDMNNRTFPLRRILSDLARRSPTELRVFLRQPNVEDQLGQDYTQPGWATLADGPETSRWLAEAHFMLAGTDTFVSNMESQLLVSKVEPERIALQAFGAGHVQPLELGEDRLPPE